MKVVKVGVALTVQRATTDRWHSADCINPLDVESPDPKEIAADLSIYRQLFQNAGIHNKTMNVLHSLCSIGLFGLLLFLSACGSESPLPPPSPRQVPTTDPLLRARQNYESAHFDTAIQIALSGIKSDSTSVALHNILASSYAAQGRYALAIAALKTAVQIDTSFTTGFINLGGIHTKLGHLDLAGPYLRRALALDAENSPVRRRLGELYLATGQYAKASEELHRALRLLGDDATVHYFLGQSLAAEERETEAIEAFQRATELDTGFLDAYYRLALLARKAGKPQIARTAMAKFRQLKAIADEDVEIGKQMQRMRAAILNVPEDPTHHFNLGLFFAKRAYFAEAENKFNRAVSLSADKAVMLTRIGKNLAMLEQPEVAIHYLEQAIERDSTYTPALFDAGHISGRLGRHAEAINYFRRLVDRKPGGVEGWYFLGLALVSSGNNTEAEQALLHAQQLDTSDAKMTAQISKLLKLVRKESR